MHKESKIQEVTLQTAYEAMQVFDGFYSALRALLSFTCEQNGTETLKNESASCFFGHHNILR